MDIGNRIKREELISAAVSWFAFSGSCQSVVIRLSKKREHPRDLVKRSPVQAVHNVPAHFICLKANTISLGCC